MKKSKTGRWSGALTNFSASGLSPIFSTNVTGANSTPSLSFSLSNINQYQVLGRSASGSGVPSYVTPTSAFISDFSTAARSLFSVTNIGSSGNATYNPATGVFNIPVYSGGTGPGGSTNPPVVKNYNTGAEDTSRGGYLSDRNLSAYKAIGLPSYKVNGYEGFTAYGDTFRTVKPAVYSVRNLGGTPTNIADSLQSIFNNPDISWVIVEWDSAAVYNLSGATSINAHGKKMTVSPNVSFTNGTIDSLVADLSPFSKAFDTSMVLTNFKTTTNSITPMNLGATRNGNAVRFIARTVQLAASNRLKVDATGLNFNIDGDVLLPAFSWIDGGTYAMNSKSRFITGTAKADSIRLENMKINMSGTQGNTQEYTFDIQTVGDSSYGLIINNVRVENARTNYYVIRLRAQYGATISNCYINESGSTSILFSYCKYTSVFNNRVFNSGRGGICVFSYNYDTKIIGNTVIGTNQYQDPTGNDLQ